MLRPLMHEIPAKMRKRNYYLLSLHMSSPGSKKQRLKGGAQPLIWPMQFRDQGLSTTYLRGKELLYAAQLGGILGLNNGREQAIMAVADIPDARILPITVH